MSASWEVMAREAVPALGAVVMPSPVGSLKLVGAGHTLFGVYFLPEDAGGTAGRSEEVPDWPGATDAVRQLEEYFRGRRQSFDLPLALVGTPFQVAVWTQLAAIPYGRTVSYREVARRVGRETATRAVGAAVGANALSIVVPCHRVVGQDGSLTGYGGGLHHKRWLLALEQGHLFSAR
jgi:methylated-DNA-[protein]-cysteine S-methyltransferase